MKLNKLLPIVALSGIATIAVPLASCSTNGGDTPEKSVEFTVDSETTDATAATLTLDWTPSEDSMAFSHLTASSATVDIQTAEFVGESRPQQIDLTFKEEIDQDLDDVVIEFDYEDKTQKFTSHAKLENVHIDPYVPEGVIDLTIEESLEAAETMYFIHSQTMDIVGGRKYDIKIDMSTWVAIQSEPVGSNWLFGFGIWKEIRCASVDASSADNMVAIDGTPATISVNDPGEVGFNILSISTDIEHDDIVTASLVFEDDYTNGYFFMSQGI